MPTWPWYRRSTCCSVSTSINSRWSTTACGSGGGDILLQSLGALLSGHLRKQDMLARLDSNGFGALLENCPPAAGERIAESIRAGIEHFRFEYAGNVFPLSASIGLLAVTADNDGLAAVLNAGDAACDRARGAGGNRIRLEWLGGDKAAMTLGRTDGAARLSRDCGRTPQLAVDSYGIRFTCPRRRSFRQPLTQHKEKRPVDVYLGVAR